MKLAKPELCCFIAVFSPRRCVQTARRRPSLFRQSTEAHGGPPKPLVAAAIIAGCVILVRTILPHVASVLPHVRPIPVQVVPVVVEVAAIASHVTVVDMKARVDAFGAGEALIASTREEAAITEHDGSGNAAFTPFIVMPATVHEEHSLAAAHAPAIRPMIPSAADVDGVVLVLVIVRHISGTRTDHDCGDADADGYAGSGNIRQR